MSGFGSPAAYTIGYHPPFRSGRLSTSRTEVLHLTIAYAVLAFEMAYIRALLVGNGPSPTADPSVLLTWAPFGLLAALTAFVLHEMGHKIAAERHGFWAEFRMSTFGLLFSLVVALAVGAIFAAPGATVVGGMGDTREWGRTSLAGPLVNLGFGAIFLALWPAMLLLGLGAWVVSLELLIFLNAWFATFNLIPVAILDGRKVYRWDRRIWAAAFGVSALFSAAMFVTVFLPAGVI